MKNFFNSNKERGQQLAASEKNAKTQNEHILFCLSLLPLKGKTAWDIYVWFGYKNWPITSIRRALSTMAEPMTPKNPMGGLLKETGEMRKGGFGKLNRVYQITKAGLNYKTK